VLAFPHLKPTATSWSARSVLRVGLPTPQTDRHHLVRMRRGWTRSRRRATRRRSILIAVRRVAGGERRPKRRLPCHGWGGGVWNASPRRRIYATAEGNGAVSAGSRRRTRTMADGKSARGACSLRRNWTRIEGNRVGDAGSLHRYCTMKICDRRRRCPGARNRGNLRCVIGQAGSRCTSISWNKRRCPLHCCRRAGRAWCTAIELSISGAKGTWLTRVRVSARGVVSP